MNRPLLLYWSFVAGLIGGILILLGTAFMVLMMSAMGDMMGMMPGGMMGGWPGAPAGAMMFWMLSWGAITGTVALVGALQVRDGKSPMAWGVVLVVAGVLSFPVMGGFFMGGLAAMAAGILAIAASTPKTATPPQAPPP